MAFPFELKRFEALQRLASERLGALNHAEIGVLRRSTSTGNDRLVRHLRRPAIRAAVLRWLATDKDAAQYIDPQGIRVENVAIVSVVDLRFCKLLFPVRFDYCSFDGLLMLTGAELFGLYLFSCNSEAGIDADRLTATGHVFFRNIEARNEIRLVEAQIGGDLDCAGATLNSARVALSANSARITGSIFLNRGFSSTGAISLLGTQVGGSLEMAGARIEAIGESLWADGAKVSGSVILNRGVSATGTVRLLETVVGGNLECEGATLRSLNTEGAKIAGNVLLRSGFSSSSAISMIGSEVGGRLDCGSAQIASLSCDSARIQGALIWTDMRGASDTTLRLANATVGTLHDDRASWPAPGHLYIQDFVYQDLVLHKEAAPDQIARNAFADPIRLNVEDRIAWLRRQRDDELEYAQPWMQLAKLLETNGDSKGAKKVAYEYHRVQVRRDRLAWFGSLPYHLLEEEPLRIGFPILSLWLLGSLVYWRANRMGVMAPTDKEARKALEKSRSLPVGYAPFNPVIYTLENVLPVVKLGQDSAWAPDNSVTTKSWLPSRPAWLRKVAERWWLTRYMTHLSYGRLTLLRWSLIILGWASALILAAAISSQFKP